MVRVRQLADERASRGTSELASLGQAKRVEEKEIFLEKNFLLLYKNLLKKNNISPKPLKTAETIQKRIVT